MTELPPSPPESLKAPSQVSLSDKSAWLADVPFSEGFRRSTFLLRHKFRTLTLIFFLGGTITAFLVWPIDQLLQLIAIQLLNQLLDPFSDPFLLLNLLSIDLAWGLVRDFIITLSVFVINCYAIYYIVHAYPSLNLLLIGQTSTAFPIVKAFSTGFLVAGILTLANLLPLVGFIFHILVFFVPPLVIMKDYPVFNTLNQSFRMRHGYWQRILSAFIVSYLFSLFAGSLGQMIYLNIEILFLLLGIPLGIVGSILLILLTQLPIAMVAPFYPLLSLTFYSGGLAGAEDHDRRRYLRQLQRSQSRYRPIPQVSEPITPTCLHCGMALKPGATFCHHCGLRITNQSVTKELSK